MAKAIGIDLGTTNTVAAEVQRGHAEPVTIQVNNYGFLTRSVVAYQNGTWLVGADAEEVGKYAPASVVASTKRFIGLNFGDQRIQPDVALLNRVPLHPRVVKPPLGESGVRMRFYPDGSPSLDLSPIELASLILKQVKREAESAVGSVITHAVITAPAYFDAARKEATRQAGEAAGLQVQRIISEPQAAALAYGMRLDASATETVLVFDMGGGTLDVTVCAIGKSDCVELAVDGDNHLGGDDLDVRLEQLVLKRLRDASGVDFLETDSADTKVIQTLQFELRRECRGAKERLSTAYEVTIKDCWRVHPNFGVLGTGPVNVTRVEFEAALSDLVDKAVRLTQQALDKSGCTLGDIDRVLLIGGSTYVPVIRERLRAMFGSEKVRADVNPMAAVAQGAAILAASLPNLVLCPQCRTDQPADAATCPRCGAVLAPESASASPTPDGPRRQVISTTPRTISVKTAQGNLVPLFKHGAQYSPTGGSSLTQARETFRLARTGVRTLRVEFYEGEGQRADDPQNAYYADFTIYGLQADTRQGEEVILEATLNGDGSLAGTMTFRGRIYPYVASPSQWRGQLVDTIEEARVLLPNVSDGAARAQLQQVIDHAEDVVIERTSDARAGRAALNALSSAIDGYDIAPQHESQEMEKLSLSLLIGGAMFEYGGAWVNLLPMVTAPALRDALLGESQLLSALRSAVVEGRQIKARNDTAYAERAAERIDALTHASDLLYPLVFARIISEYSDDNGRERGPGGLLAQIEWERLRQQGNGSSQHREAATPEGSKQQVASDIGALLEQMQTTIITNPAVFHGQFQRVLQLMDQFQLAQG